MPKQHPVRWCPYCGHDVTADKWDEHLETCSDRSPGDLPRRRGEARGLMGVEWGDTAQDQES